VPHKIARHDDAPGRLYMQNHGGWGEWEGPGGKRPDIGVLRSDDYGQSWYSIAKGLPSDFGFPIVVHPHDADSVYVVPLEPATRTCPGGAPPSGENGGRSWKRLARGFPKTESFFTVQRDAWTSTRSLPQPSTSARPRGSSGWAAKGARGWSCLFDSLPPVHCVKAAVV